MRNSFLNGRKQNKCRQTAVGRGPVPSPGTAAVSLPFLPPVTVETDGHLLSAGGLALAITSQSLNSHQGSLELTIPLCNMQDPLATWLVI